MLTLWYKLSTRILQLVVFLPSRCYFSICVGIVTKLDAWHITMPCRIYHVKLKKLVLRALPTSSMKCLTWTAWLWLKARMCSCKPADFTQVFARCRVFWSSGRFSKHGWKLNSLVILACSVVTSIPKVYGTHRNGNQLYQQRILTLHTRFASVLL